VNVPFLQILDNHSEFPKLWRNNASRTANTTLNEAEIIAKKMNDEYVSVETFNFGNLDSKKQPKY
jgi:ATP-dependent Clp protease ATP-binding subunit ClpB